MRIQLTLIASLALSACVGTIGDRDDSSGKNAGPGTIDDPYQDNGWAEPAMRRLTTTQYAHSIHDVFGDHIIVDAALEADETNELFLSMGAAKVGTSEYGVEQYHGAALDIAEQVVAGSAQYPQLSSCAPYTPGDSCIADAISYFGNRLWRRDLSDEEIARIAAVQDAAEEDDPAIWELGMTHALAALIGSPNFIYLPEAGELDEDSGAYRYTSQEMASRLSYMLWGSTPDDALLAAARDDALTSPDAIREQAERMLTHARAADLATRFFGEAWMVAAMEYNDKNSDVFPAWTPQLMNDYLAEFDSVLRALVYSDGDLRHLFTGGADPDASLLKSGAVIAAVSPSDRTSPTQRGVFVLERILCTEIPPPPANVNDEIEVPQPGEGVSLKEKLEIHRTDPACASCHDLVDPLGFTFEHYDGIGQYRDDDNGNPIDATGELAGVTFDGVDDLIDYIVSDPRMTECIAERLFTFAAAHEPTGNEQDAVEAIDESLRGHHRFNALVLDIVTSEAFRNLQPVPGE